MPYAGLFSWWISSITFNIVFVIAASIYLYVRRTTPEKEALRGVKKLIRVVEDFVFVWVLLGLLVFYIYSVAVGSYTLFAAGNIVVEVLLVVYVLKAGKPSEGQQT
jgi:hypothetical protein